MTISLNGLRMHIKKSISNYYNRCKIKQKIITRCCHYFEKQSRVIIQITFAPN